LLTVIPYPHLLIYPGILGDAANGEGTRGPSARAELSSSRAPRETFQLRFFASSLSYLITTPLPLKADQSKYTDILTIENLNFIAEEREGKVDVKAAVEYFSLSPSYEALSSLAVSLFP
jgi:hypothetical protein